MVVMGLDIGYSNLKVCFGEAGEIPEGLCYPAGAAPVERLPGGVRSGKGFEGFRVQVDGRLWATGIHPRRFEVWERSLHPDYAATPSYRALFYTALVLSGRDEIDRVVTGLPAAQYEERRAALSWMAGVHSVAAKRQVRVKEVKVVPQPVGGFMAALGEVEAEVAEVLAEGRVLVVDPGHFSFDWVLIQQGELQKRSCGSSVEAMAALLEGAAAKIGEDFGGRVEADRIEQALQEGKEHILLFGRKVEIAPYVEQAVREVVPVAVERLRVAMRRQEGDLDALVLVGGGAAWWEGGIRELFPKVPVIRPVDPILANARGFFELGADGG